MNVLTNLKSGDIELTVMKIKRNHHSTLGDQIIEWNGVILCNRSDQEVQQILLSQFSDEEVEIVYLSRDEFYEAYEVDLKLGQGDYTNQVSALQASATNSNDMFEQYAKIGRSNQDPRAQARYSGEPFKDSIRRKLSLSSLSHKWTR